MKGAMNMIINYCKSTPLLILQLVFNFEVKKYSANVLSFADTQLSRLTYRDHRFVQEHSPLKKSAKAAVYLP